MSLLLGIILFVFGAGWFAIRRYEKRQDLRLVKDGLRVTGEVVEVVTHPQEDDMQTGQYKLVVDYVVGRYTHTVKSRDGSVNWAGEIGKHYVVLVDPDDPDKARLEMDAGRGLWSFGYLLVAVLGALMILAEFFTD